MTASLDAPAPALAQPPARPGSAAVRTGLPLAPWALTAVVLSGQAMASLDSAIVNVAGPARMPVVLLALAAALAVTGAALARHALTRPASRAAAR